MEYTDITYEVDGPAAVLTINRPDRMNAFRATTTEELRFTKSLKVEKVSVVTAPARAHTHTSRQNTATFT